MGTRRAGLIKQGSVTSSLIDLTVTTEIPHVELGRCLLLARSTTPFCYWMPITGWKMNTSSTALGWLKPSSAIYNSAIMSSLGGNSSEPMEQQCHWMRKKVMWIPIVSFSCVAHFICFHFGQLCQKLFRQSVIEFSIKYYRTNSYSGPNA